MKSCLRCFAFAALANFLLLGHGNAQPTFAHDIAPIIYRNCAVCHRPGEAGPFPLLTYEDVKKHAHQIATVTRSRYMPPWLPQPGYGDFQDERRLTDAEIRLIADWVGTGAPEGPVSAIPPLPNFTIDWQLGTPDMILRVSHPFLMPASGPDIFWNFLFRPDIDATRYVRAVEIRPGGDRIVHHANILVDRIGSARRLANSSSAGFAGMDVTIDRNPFDPDSHFLFWKPGTIPYSEPDGLSWRLDPGNYLILNTHLQPTGKQEKVAPTIGLYFADKPPNRFPLLIELEHDGALDIPPGDRDFVISDDFRLPVAVDALAVYPHAHYLGKLLEAYATLPDGSRKWLIRIPDWDLNWQAVYRYREPVFLPKSSVISMRYHFDNSSANPRNPNNPPKRIRAGNQATDEMGHLWLQVLPRGGGDHRREVQEALMRHQLEKYPNDFAAHLNLGALLMARLNAQEAVAMLEAATRIDAMRPEAHDMLGLALETVGRTTEAIVQFRIALRVGPDYLSARYNLAVALAKAGQFSEAVENLRRVAAAYPRNARLQNQLGELLTHQGKYPEALAQFDKALALDPSNEAARKNREHVLQQIAGR